MVYFKFGLFLEPLKSYDRAWFEAPCRFGKVLFFL
jgi:hypothetical protein